MSYLPHITRLSPWFVTGQPCCSADPQFPWKENTGMVLPRRPCLLLSVYEVPVFRFRSVLWTDEQTGWACFWFLLVLLECVCVCVRAHTCICLWWLLRFSIELESPRLTRWKTKKYPNGNQSENDICASLC